ncbi:MAG: HAMP domain-containing histidine kinase [Bacteroidales bacterium]|jgi:signal transduction histidine kinase|nr:HAMP domain-containing histidine kinase [Bacteroidales bacterium]
MWHLFNNPSRHKSKIETEREKLLQHVHSLEEGICFYSCAKQVEFYNALFLQHIDTITDRSSNPLAVFYDTAFEEVQTFLKQNEHTSENNYLETQIKKQGKIFSLRMNIFEDKSFEIILNDITKQEKNRLLKQELTGNIAHELRTPVTSIRGYLETLLEQPLDEDKRRYFIRQAYEKAVVLSELISDMSLITKIEDAPQSFNLESVSLFNLLTELKTDIALPLQDKHIDMQWNISDNLLLQGNKNLLYSIFRNLADNTIRYAGEGITIHITKYNEDNDFYYFSYYDTGKGIADESHLSRLFERFYCINEGRTRNTGGSGLGLSIVRNAVAFHHGTIVAKNRTEGGLEFLFSLKK